MNFDSQTISLSIEGKYTELSFQEALDQGKVTQEQLDMSHQALLLGVFRDLEEQGFKSVTNTSDCFCIFEDRNGNRYECKDEADVYKLEELGYLP